MNRFFNWAFKTRGNLVKQLAAGENIAMEKMFLSFTSHNPVFLSDGPAGLNGAVKGVGFAPKPEYLEETLKDYIAHIKTYDPADKSYQRRGLQVLIKNLYSDEAEKRIDFSRLFSLEMAYKKTYENYSASSRASLLFYQPPSVSFELKGKMALAGERHPKDAAVSPYDLPLLQQFINAQHDVYHAANTDIWKTRLAYIFTIEEIWDKSTGLDGFGQRVEYSL
jgi:hypothetical protein